MIDKDKFKLWLKESKNYSPKVCKDIVCRLHRVEGILNFTGKPSYIFELQNTDSFKSLSVSVRSQCKKAALLYFEFLDKN